MWIAQLPAEWRARLENAALVPVRTGMGGASVFRIGSGPMAGAYLKVAEGAAAAAIRDEIERTRWLQSQGISVPAILLAHQDGPPTFVLMSAVAGTPVASLDVDASAAARTLAKAITRLHALPVHACPFEETVAVRLQRARADVAAGRVDEQAFDDRNAGVAAADLLRRLGAECPAHEDLVVVHGDATLDNLLLAADGQVGFVDCGRAGRADRHVDLVLIADGLADRFGSVARQIFLSAYGPERWDEDKATFFRDLYELF